MEFIAVLAVLVAIVAVAFAIRGRKTTKKEVTLSQLIAECEACAIAHASAVSAVQICMGKDSAAELATLKAAINKLKS